MTSIYRAIQTKFLGPTNHRSARVKATADAGTITIEWDHRLGIAENHRAAAVALADRFNWGGEWIGGSLPGSGYAFVRKEG